jgi:E3 ubiquitin-protein ligase HECTD1
LPYGKLEDILSREPAALNCHTNDDKKAWFSIDLGVWIIPSAYTLRHARGYGRSALRNWQLQVRNFDINLKPRNALNFFDFEGFKGWHKLDNSV